MTAYAFVQLIGCDELQEIHRHETHPIYNSELILKNFWQKFKVVNLLAHKILPEPTAYFTAALRILKNENKFELSLLSTEKKMIPRN